MRPSVDEKMNEIQSVSALIEDLYRRYGETCVAKVALKEALEARDLDRFAATPSQTDLVDQLLIWGLLDWEEAEEGYFLSPESLEWLDTGRLEIEVALLWSGTFETGSGARPERSQAAPIEPTAPSAEAHAPVGSEDAVEPESNDGTWASFKNRTIPWGQMAIGMWLMTLFLALYTIYETKTGKGPTQTYYLHW